MNFYKHYIGDFQRGTGHLSLTERGAYLCLIHHYYATEKPLPKDLDALCRIAGAVSKIERDAVKVAIGFFVPVESGLMSARIEAELEKAGETSSTNRDIALAREAKRRAEKQARTEHEQSTKRAQSVPRTEHETDTNGAPTRHQTPDTKVNREPLVSAVPQLPRLAGQHAQYTENQLKLFNKRERTNDNAVMHAIASKLSELELKAVSAYISGLN